MRIKHWQGYGCVNAKRISTRRIGIADYEVEILVRGNHEWGLEAVSRYAIWEWLMKKLVKDCTSWTYITDWTIKSGYDPHTRERTALYTIDYVK